MKAYACIICNTLFDKEDGACPKCNTSVDSDIMKTDSFNTCQVMRRKLVGKSTINMATGEKSEMTEEWVTEKCGIPLFSYDDRINGECKSCKSGWTHKNNYKINKVIKNTTS